jgi:protein phosphatase
MTTPTALHITFCAQTDIGQVRKGNEDNFLILDLVSKTSWTGIGEETTGLQMLELSAQGAVFAVSDGMGGALAGEVASRMAVEIVCDIMPQLRVQYSHLSLSEQLRLAIEQANSTIHIESIINSQRRGMGATFTAVALADQHACFAQVGDSRAHLIRQGEITRITKDQSVVQQLIDLGQITEEEAPTHPRRNYILQALGATHEIDVVISLLPLCADDLLLLCSDGLSGKMNNEEMAAIVAESADLQEACTSLIKLANERGGEDNITVVLLKVTGGNLVAPSDEPIEPEFVARPPDTPRDFLPEDVGLPPPLTSALSAPRSSRMPSLMNAIARSDEFAAFDPPPPPASTEAPSPPIEPEPSRPDTALPVGKRGLDGRKVALVFVAVALLLSLTAVYLNYRFTPGRGAMQQQVQKDQLALIESLRGRIANLRARANGSAEIMTRLDQCSQRLDEALTLPATKHQDIGRACSEVETALYLLEQQQSGAK